MAWTAQLIPADSPPPSPPFNLSPPNTRAFTTGTPPAPRYHHSAVVYGSSMFVFGELPLTSGAPCPLWGSQLPCPATWPRAHLRCPASLSLSICCLFPPESSGFLHWPRGLARAPVALWVPFPHCATLEGLEWSAFVTGREGGGSLPSSVTPPGAEDRVLLISGSPEPRAGSGRQ